jgi:ABC-2 type transport system ATP-binding protein
MVKSVYPKKKEPKQNFDELENYIKSCISKGINSKDIEKSLLDSGWPKGVVKDALSKYVTEPAPRFKLGREEAKQEFDDDPSLIKFNNVTKQFGEHTILNNITFNVDAGDIFGIIGLSGSGKTTLLNSIIGFLPLDSGDVLFRSSRADDFNSVFKKQAHAMKTIGFAPQDPSFYSRLTAEENLHHFGILYNIPKNLRTETVQKLLELTELEDSKDTFAQNLSGGMQRRLGIACSLIHDPQIVILDEPTADLDPLLRKEMCNLISKINEKGTTVIIASHFLSDMESLCNKIGILHNGQLIEVGTPDELKDMYSKNEEIHLETISGNYAKIIRDLSKEKLDIARITQEEHKLVIFTKKAEKVLHRLLHIVEKNNEKLVDVDVNKPSLREVFESLVSKKASG